MSTSSDYVYLKNRCYNLKNKIISTIKFLNSASFEMAHTLDVGDFFQVNGHSADNGKFKKTKTDIDYLKAYLQNNVLPYLDRQIYVAESKIQELLIMEKAHDRT